MNQLSIVNLIFEKKIRNHIPVTRMAVSDFGDVMLAVPDAYQPRLYRLARISPLGTSAELGTFSVEKVQHADLSPDARVFVVDTIDDVYVFRDWEKKRFFPNSRSNYGNISLSASGEVFVVALADMIASSHSVALVNTGGAQVWVKSFPVNITSLRISTDALYVLVGFGDGSAVLLDAGRKIVWRREFDYPVSSVAVSPDGELSVVCTRDGLVYGIGKEGNCLWETDCESPVVNTAIDSIGANIVIASNSDDRSGMIRFLSRDGMQRVEHYTRSGINSIAISPNGRFLAVSSQDGTFAIMEVNQTSGSIRPTDKIKAFYEDAADSLAKDDLQSAADAFTRILELSPDEVDACRQLIETKNRLVQQCFDQVEELIEEDGVESAFERIKSAAAIDLSDIELLAKLAELRAKIVKKALDEFAEIERSGDLEKAAEKLRTVIGMEFTNLKAREQLRYINARLLDLYVSEAQKSICDDPDKAVELLEKALPLTERLDVQDLLAKALSAQAMAQGMSLYSENRYLESLVYFRKALLFDPNNTEAHRYTEYASNLRHDDAHFDRFRKLE